MESSQDARYREAAAQFGAALERLARAYEADPERRLDLLQEIHLALWRSLAAWGGACSLGTWVYRVAHNAAASYVMRERRARRQAWMSLEELDAMPDPAAAEAAAGEREALSRLLDIVHGLKPLDRQVILSYLEGLDAASISEITGISPGNVATKIHRIKNVLARRFQQGACHGE